jgi:hypothetical protein
VRLDYVPCYVDHYQSEPYRLIGYSIVDGRPMAHFADGSIVQSLYRTEHDLVRAGDQDWRERVRRVVD